MANFALGFLIGSLLMYAAIASYGNSIQSIFQF